MTRRRKTDRRPWQGHEDALITAFAARRLRAQDAADALGRFTRSAVIARANRIGVAFDPDPDLVARACRAGIAVYQAERRARG